ncbi:hypothetical protein [Ginsengibacter hankyongi]|nr:hypothetical protein [Ginsengibacter hankyongi]
MKEFRQCGQKWLVILSIWVMNFAHQLEEESGSAEEQPASNKVDAKR